MKVTADFLLEFLSLSRRLQKGSFISDAPVLTRFCGARLKALLPGPHSGLSPAFPL
jgi:hypothetical protein